MGAGTSSQGGAAVSTRAKTYTIKPLEWRDMGIWFEAKPIGFEYTVSRSAPRSRPVDRFAWFAGESDHVGNYCHSLEAGKAACEAHRQAQIESVLEEVQPAAPEATP